MRSIAREAARAQRMQESAQRRDVAERQRYQKWAAKKAREDYLASRLGETEEMTRSIQEADEAISSLLVRALGCDPAVELSSTKIPFSPGIFSPAYIPPEPQKEDYAPQRVAFLARFLPGARPKQEKFNAIAATTYEEALATYRKKIFDREAARAAFNFNEERKKLEAEKNSSEIDDLIARLTAREHLAGCGNSSLVVG